VLQRLGYHFTYQALLPFFFALNQAYLEQYTGFKLVNTLVLLGLLFVVTMNSLKKNGYFRVDGMQCDTLDTLHDY